MSAPTEETGEALAAVEEPAVRRLQSRSNSRGLLRLVVHLTAIASAGGLYTLAIASAPWVLTGLLAIAYGFTLVTMFAAMHEAVHRTSFRSQWLNDSVAWFAGLLSFYNSTFYRPYHGWHHRFTQLPGKDPELEDLKPTNWTSYLLELSGVLWWLGKLRTYARLALGKFESYAFLNERTGRLVVRSVRLQLLVYATAIAVSLALGHALFVTYWLAPVALAQPLLRGIVMAEHTGCTNDSNPLTNTRTTRTVWLVQLLMWEMPYHAEHHRHPALPFFVLEQVHADYGTQLRHVERAGYFGFHRALIKQFSAKASLERVT